MQTQPETLWQTADHEYPFDHTVPRRFLSDAVFHAVFSAVQPVRHWNHLHQYPADCRLDSLGDFTFIQFSSLF